MTAPTLTSIQYVAGATSTVYLIFDRGISVSGGSELDGFTFTTIDGATDHTSGASFVDAGGSVLQLTLAVDLASEGLAVDYDSGTGTVVEATAPNDPLASFTDEYGIAVPSADYPLSYVIKPALSIASGVVTATLQVFLNPIDIEIVGKYGPIQIALSGTYGVTGSNPSGIDLTAGAVTILDGVSFSVTFTNASEVSYAVDAATDWQDKIAAKIATQLGARRDTDQSITLADQTITQV